MSAEGRPTLSETWPDVWNHPSEQEVAADPEPAPRPGAERPEPVAEPDDRAIPGPVRSGVAATAEALHRKIDEPLPETGMPPESVLSELQDRVTEGLAGTTGPRYFGYVTGGLLPAAGLAKAWSIGVDQNLGMWSLSPAGATLELVALRWIAELLGVPWASGVFTTGATMANAIGLAVARHAFAKRRGIDVMAEGVRALPPYAIYGSDELHLSDYKAIRTLGLGSGTVRSIPIDDGYAMRADLLAERIERDRAEGVEPLVVIAQAGSVNTGAADPLEAIADICAEHRTWMHVDGAFGAFFRLCERTAPMVEGMERADSLAVDGHKWLNLPHGTGWALLKDPDLHRETFAGTAGYLTRQEGAGPDLHEYGFEGSRDWRGVAAWAAIKELGRTGIADLVTRCCDLTGQLAERVDASDCLEMTAPAPSCVACFRYRPAGWNDGSQLDELNRQIVLDVARGEEVFATGATLDSGYCVRACIVNWRTRWEDVELLLRAVSEAGDRLSG